MLFVGISLTVYAVVPRVSITSITVANVTTTTATVVIESIGASEAVLEIYRDDVLLESCTVLSDATEETDEVTFTYTISGLAPNTKYEVKGISDDFGDSDKARCSIEFTTTIG